MTRVAKELLEQERRFWTAMKEKDAASAGLLTASECILVGAQGVSSIDGANVADLIKGAPWVLEHFAIDENGSKVQLIGDDVAIVA